MTVIVRSRTPRRASARIALHAGPIPHQREVPALGAHLAFIPFGFRFGAAFGLGWRGGGGAAGLAPLHLLELLCGRKIVLGFLLQRDGAFDGIGDAAVGGLRRQGGDLRAA